MLKFLAWFLLPFTLPFHVYVWLNNMGKKETGDDQA